MRTKVNTVENRFYISLLGVVIMLASYWHYANPPNPWVIFLAAASLLGGVGISRWKARRGHFDQKS
jgi:hypothetical protein